MTSLEQEILNYRAAFCAAHATRPINEEEVARILSECRLLTTPQSREPHAILSNPQTQTARLQRPDLPYRFGNSHDRMDGRPNLLAAPPMRALTFIALAGFCAWFWATIISWLWTLV
jgi:hypothetical protein